MGHEITAFSKCLAHSVASWEESNITIWVSHSIVKHHGFIDVIHHRAKSAPRPRCQQLESMSEHTASGSGIVHSSELLPA